MISDTQVGVKIVLALYLVTNTAWKLFLASWYPRLAGPMASPDFSFFHCVQILTEGSRRLYLFAQYLFYVRLPARQNAFLKQTV